ncbi:MAG: bifunctional ornithine acetyltransferase/N-acetylglutamate synthase [Atribacter sp.]|uniref:bifunctional ornithine acetyltransferase/N-acetylglutamate synthase n=1 Tax=Atribacter sp. TaxID=2847780 RepID=UPI003D97E8BC
MNTEFEWLTGGGVTSSKGFLACGVAAGIKANRNDMAMVLSERPATAAGLFTSNRAAAAPVVVDRERVASGRCRGVVVNAGCANACTGPAGLRGRRGDGEDGGRGRPGCRSPRCW